MLDRILRTLLDPEETDPEKSAIIHRKLDRSALLILWCFVYILVSIYLLIRKAFGLPPVLDAFLNSPVVDVLLLKTGAITAYMIALLAGMDAPRKKPSYSVEGRYKLHHYYGKHARTLLWALKISVAIELLIDLFYFL
ncbi:MAG: hypothetical protein NTW07_13200 [candidate division Zixibacteria bacterium]|nr:hypothetical protein [candidate division Zixibacteria bacterium]